MLNTAYFIIQFPNIVKPLFNKTKRLNKKSFYFTKKCLFKELILYYFFTINLTTFVLLHVYKVYNRQLDIL